MTTHYGGDLTAYIFPGPIDGFQVFTTPALTSAVTDLLLSDAVTAATAVVGDPTRYYDFNRVATLAGPVWAAKTVNADGTVNPAGGAIRIDPDPHNTYAGLPAPATPAGFVATVQADGSLAYGAQTGSGSSVGAVDF